MNLQQYANHRKALGLRGTSHVAVLKAIERCLVNSAGMPTQVRKVAPGFNRAWVPGKGG